MLTGKQTNTDRDTYVKNCSSRTATWHASRLAFPLPLDLVVARPGTLTDVLVLDLALVWARMWELWELCGAGALESLGSRFADEGEGEGEAAEAPALWLSLHI